MHCPGCHTRNGSIFTIISSVAVFRIFVQCWGRQITGMLALTDLDSPITTQVYGSHAQGIHSNDFSIRVEVMERREEEEPITDRKCIGQHPHGSDADPSQYSQTQPVWFWLHRVEFPLILTLTISGGNANLTQCHHLGETSPYTGCVQYSVGWRGVWITLAFIYRNGGGGSIGCFALSWGRAGPASRPASVPVRVRQALACPWNGWG